jgi:hypothetical protein
MPGQRNSLVRFWAQPAPDSKQNAQANSGTPTASLCQPGFSANRIKMPPDAATTPDAATALGLHLAGYTYVEIAAELGCTPDEAYDLVRQALKTMKR